MQLEIESHLAETKPEKAQEESIVFDSKMEMEQCLQALEMFELRDELNQYKIIK
tara:strand:- start:65 stop:226 length:162 start_codon:yes stop_codon:yes gene_type:complete